MLILFLEAFLLISLVRSLLKSQRSMVWHALFWITFWSLLWLLVIQMEISYISPDGTYGSDARYYYESMMSTVESGKWWPDISIFNPGYVAFGTLVLLTSFSNSVIWVKLANIGLLLLSIALGFYILQLYGVSIKTSFFVMVLAGTNGIVTWMAGRNLKDTLVLFITLMSIAGVKFLLSRKFHSFPKILCVLGFGYVVGNMLRTVRQWGFYWVLIIVGATIIESFFKKEVFHSAFSKSKSWLFTIMILGLVLAIWLVKSYQTVIRDFSIASMFAEEVWSKEKGLILDKSNLIEVVLAVPRFLIGPGPIRAIWGWKAFQVTTSVGNLLIFLGSIQWWIYLPILILVVLQGPSYWLRYSSVFIPLAVFIAIYSIGFSGSPDTRSRAIAYVLSMIGTAPYLDKILQRKKARWFLYYSWIAILVWLVGMATSYVSLKEIL